jgi:hypothetical protein
MVRFYPPHTIRSLNTVKLASIVQLGDQPGICVTTDADPNKPEAEKLRGIVVYDQASAQFRYEYGEWPRVIVFSGRAEIRPDLTTFIARVGPHRGSTSELYMQEDKALISVPIGAAQYLVDLNDGVLREFREPSQQVVLTSAFRRWSLGLNEGGTFLSLIEASAADETSSSGTWEGHVKIKEY